MIKNILAAAIVVALGACSSGSDNGSSNSDNSGAVNNDGNNAGNANQGGTISSPGGGAGPVTTTSAGSYTGTIGSSTGVFVINNDFDLAGLAFNADGSALSVFGNVGSGSTFTGDLRQYIHQESVSDNPSIPVGAAGSFGAIGGRAGNDLSVNVNIVNGQSVESTADSATSVMLLGTEGSSVSPATAASMAGTWAGVHSFCDTAGTNCQLLTTTMTFNGTTVTGSTEVTDSAGVDMFLVLINGSITEFGDAALIDFTWGDAPLYSGVAFFQPGDPTRLVFIGENDTNADNPTISAIMTAQ